MRWPSRTLLQLSQRQWHQSCPAAGERWVKLAPRATPHKQGWTHNAALSEPLPSPGTSSSR